MSPPAVVMDTNVLVSGLLSGDTDAPTVQVLDAVLDGKFRCVVSRALLVEYREVLLATRIRRYHGLSPGHIDRILVEFAEDAVLREPAVSHEPAPDPDDAHLWGLLAAHPRAVMITGDRLLVERAPDWASIVSPRAALQLLEP